MGMASLVDRLLLAVADDREDAGVAFRAVYQPVGGPGGRVAPPTFPVAEVEVRAAQREGRLPRPYVFERRLVDGVETARWWWIRFRRRRIGWSRPCLQRGMLVALICRCSSW